MRGVSRGRCFRAGGGPDGERDTSQDRNFPGKWRRTAMTRAFEAVTVVRWRP